jgi:hypothetical protein
MPALTRRRDPDARQESWLVYYGDVHVGSIGLRSGNPSDTDQWQWRCGFYPGSEPGDCTSGTAATFGQARADFEHAWSAFLSRRTDADFLEYRRHCAFYAWKRAMWDAGCKLPSQVASGKARCFCGEEINVTNSTAHIYAAHMEPKAA